MPGRWEGSRKKFFLKSNSRLGQRDGHKRFGPKGVRKRDGRRIVAQDGKRGAETEDEGRVFVKLVRARGRRAGGEKTRGISGRTRAMRTGPHCCPVVLAAVTVGERRGAVTGGRRKREGNRTTRSPNLTASPPLAFPLLFATRTGDEKPDPRPARLFFRRAP